MQVAHREPVPSTYDTVLATFLFTDLTDSTVMAAGMGDEAWRQLLATHHADVRRELAGFRGTEVNTASNGRFCRFDGPARAIACAQAIIDGGEPRGLVVRAGLHTGECTLVGGTGRDRGPSRGSRVGRQSR